VRTEAVADTDSIAARPLRILLVNGNFADGTLGGTQTFTENLARWLVAEGHTVAVLCHDEGRQTGHLVEQVEGVTVYRLRYPRLRTGRAARWGRRVNTLLAVHNPFVARPVGAVLRSFRPDLAHVQMLRRLTPATTAVLRRHGVPVVQTVHEELSLWRWNPFADEPADTAAPTRSRLIEGCKMLHRRISASVDAVCAPSDAILAMYRADGYFRGVPAHVVANAVPREWGDPLRVADRRRAELAATGASRPTRFLFVGRLETYKGILQILDAMDLLAHTDTPVELAVAGTGPLAADLAARVRRDPRITFHGPVRDVARQDLFAAADVLLCPSTWAEAFALVVSEAQAAALPCIVSAAGALPERIADGRTGLVVGAAAPPGEIAAAMRSLSDSAHRAPMVTAAARAASDYGPQHFLQRQTNVYRSVLELRKA
jgi:glycosyltransferase involved in cell wall biosynthesis